MSNMLRNSPMGIFNYKNFFQGGYHITNSIRLAT